MNNDVFDQLDAAAAAKGEDPYKTSPASALPVDVYAHLDAPEGSSPPDKYQQAAIEERNRLIKAGAPLPGGPVAGGLRGYTERAGQGVGMNWTDELLAGATTPLEMIKRGTLNPAEAYRYTSAREALSRHKADEETQGIGGSLAQVAGGLVTGAGVLGGTRQAVTQAPQVAGRIPYLGARAPNAVANVAKAGAFGAAAGFGEGDTLEERSRNQLAGGAFGGALGAVIPAAAWAIPKVGGAVTQVPRLFAPQRVADAEVAEAMRRAKVTPDALVQQITDANAAGQPYSVADALRKEGQRKLTAVAKVPGEQRDLITEALTARDMNMPTRVSGQIGEALGVPGTAEAAQRALLDQAGREAAPLYRQAEAIPTWSPRLQQFLDDPIARQGLRQGVEIQRLRTVGSDRPFNPRDAMITHFDEAGDPVIAGVPNMQTLNTLKTGLDRMIEGEVNPATQRPTQRGAALIDYKNRLLAEIDANNPAYAAARRTYADPMQVRTAVTAGRDMASRGRYQDNIARFLALPPNPQQGVRIGYADAVLNPLERTGNLPTQLRAKSLKGSNELDALSLYQGPSRPGTPSQLRQRLNREEEMQRTSKQALGGSATIENAADVAASPGGASAMGMATSAVNGSPIGFLRNALDLATRYGSAQSEAQRVAIARALMETDPQKVREMGARIADYELRRRGVNPFVNRPPRYPVGE